MCIEECPKCHKFTFKVDPKIQTGICDQCSYIEKIDEKVWNIKYDSVYKDLRAVIKYSDLRREQVMRVFDLYNPKSPYACFLLTAEVIQTLEKESPETYSRLNRVQPVKCAP